MKNFFSHNKGIAILEAAGSMVVIFVFLMGGFGMVEYMRAYRKINSVLERYVNETALKPFKMAESYTSNGTVKITLNKEKLMKFLNDTSSNINKELKNLDANNNVNSAYAELLIDENNGNSLELAKKPYSESVSVGNYSTQSSMDSLEQFKSEFSVYAQKSKDSSANYSLVKAPISLGNQADAYFPSSVLIGVLAGVSLEGTIIGNMLEVLGQDTSISSYKIVTLRGEINDEI